MNFNFFSNNMSIRLKMLTTLLILFLIAGSVVAGLLYYKTNTYAVSQANKKIKNLLLEHKALHNYISQHQKPEVFKLKKEGKLYKDYFQPELLSSSFITRNLHKAYNKLRKEDRLSEMYYKLAAANPRNPANKADEFESNLIRKFNVEKIKEYKEIVTQNGKDFLVYALPFAENNKGCLKCHGVPENAPRELIHRYGSKNGFNEQIGKIRAIISVRTPLDGELLEARNTFLPMAGMMFCILFVVIVGGGTFLLNKITKPINKIIHGLTNVSKYVDLGSTQVTSASKSLSDRASEQAASIEETSSSLEEMSSMTKQNAGNASQANSLMKEANQVVEQANNSMAALTDSMEEISKASEETSKIIKTIDEIAFQTNLLALNAAVEAARAGEAGAGFAVVADEVRNLAIRAAQAAKNTADLIEGTMQKVSDGSELVAKTNEDFNQVATNSSKVGELVAEIATASNEQAQGIEQANKVITAMDQVVQQVAGTAEESASSSEEMNAYAQQMKKLVDELAGLVGEKKHESSGLGKAEVIGRVRETPVEKTFTTYAKYRSLTKDPAVHRVKEIAPDQVIPMDDDFKDF